MADGGPTNQLAELLPGVLDFVLRMERPARPALTVPTIPLLRFSADEEAARKFAQKAATRRGVAVDLASPGFPPPPALGVFRPGGDPDLPDGAIGVDRTQLDAVKRCFGGVPAFVRTQ